ncbi:MAG: metallophosphoesterase [Myxococcota bacterium]|nr:metallophosphoesterase [Myxococcota bacterium]MEC9442544.1 metallophosphoesterase [Myxococcota bacterium]
MNQIRYMTTRDAKLSLWMSAVTEYVHGLDPLHSPTIRNAWVLSHPMVKAVQEHARRREDKERFALPLTKDLSKEELEVHLSNAFFEHAISGKPDPEFSADILPRKYSDYDLSGWSTCLTIYAEYILRYPETLYRSWRTEGGGNLNYGVIEESLPNDAKIALIGDWGTGMSDAEALVEHILRTLDPTIFIHLGDIYYSGTPLECTSHVYELFERVFAKVGRRIPVYTIPGNHDYYAMGAGFFPLIDQLNDNLQGAWKQAASYFCIRTEDRRWQIQAMDTGYNDRNPYSWLNEHIFDDVVATTLREDEVEWHKDKLDHFDGNTILLSHHQLFSSHSKINGSKTGKPIYLNTDLLEVFQPYFAKTPIWLWGHEHCYVQYEDGLYNLEKGRLLGCSGYEAAKREDSYKVNYPEIPYKEGMNRLALQDGYYAHGCALIDLSARVDGGPATIRYYEFPSWGQNDSPPPDAKLELLNMELIGGELPGLGAVLGYEYLEFNFPSSTVSDRAIEQALSPPEKAVTAKIAITSFEANYTDDNQYGYGAFGADVECSGDLSTAIATMKLRDNHHDKRQWQGQVKAIVLYS